MPQNRIKGDLIFQPITLLFSILLMIAVTYSVYVLDLSCISHMPLLIILDASHNQISDFFGFQPPPNLKVTQDLELTV